LQRAKATGRKILNLEFGSEGNATNQTTDTCARSSNYALQSQLTYRAQGAGHRAQGAGHRAQGAVCTVF